MGRLSTIGSERGFSLAETVIASAVMVTGVMGLVGLFITGTMANQGSHKTTHATLLATQKMEQLRSLAFAYDGQGLPVTDSTTDTSLDPPLKGNACPPACGLQPGGSVGANTPGYVDYLDGNGNELGGGVDTPPINAVFIRRWMIQPHPNNPTNTIIIQVLVTTQKTRGTADTGAVTRLPNEARFVSAKTRKFQ
jgi:hypothetical protein